MPKQLCQIQINASAGGLPARQYYQCGLNGRYRAHLIGIVWMDRSTSAGDNKLISIQSDCFRMPYGSQSQSVSFCNRSEHNMGNPQGEFPIDIEVMGNSIDLTITSSTNYTGVSTNTFMFGVLTFTVEPIHD